jgi:putative membrane protein
MSGLKRMLGCAALSFVISVPAVLAQNSSSPPGNMGQSETSPNAMASGTSQAVTPSDKRFMRAAAEGNMAEVQLGRLALQKSSNADVRKFAQRMIDDHGKANGELEQVAAKEGVTLPHQPDAKQKATKVTLSKLSGDTFDKAYMQDMLKDHKTDIAHFKTESSSGHNPAVKNFATQTLPTLESHLREAEQINPTLSQQSSLR